MNQVLESLKFWREERNLHKKKLDLNVSFANVLEEITEYLRAVNDYERIDALCDICVFSINDYSLLENYEDYKYDIINFVPQDPSIKTNIYDIVEVVGSKSLSIEIVHCAFDMMLDLKYEPESCMMETIKEISSRQQCPVQKEEWSKNGVAGKWQKWKDQPKETLYKADYESCKILKAS